MERSLILEKVLSFLVFIFEKMLVLSYIILEKM